MRTYNVFRQRGEAGLCCAVPESYAVPGFVTGGRWTYGGRLEAGTPGAPGFDARSAATAVRFNGFYLFEPLDAGRHRPG